MTNFDLFHYPTPDALAEAAAKTWLEELAAHGGNRYCVALSGGRITQTFFSAIARLAAGRRGILDAVHFFWADERCAGPADKESNYRIARELLFAPLAIAEGQIHRIRGEDAPPIAAAQAELEICTLLPGQRAAAAGIGFNFSGNGRRQPRGFFISGGIYGRPRKPGQVPERSRRQTAAQSRHFGLSRHRRRPAGMDARVWRGQGSGAAGIVKSVGQNAFCACAATSAAHQNLHGHQLVTGSLRANGRNLTDRKNGAICTMRPGSWRLARGQRKWRSLKSEIERNDPIRCLYPCDDDFAVRLGLA